MKNISNKIIFLLVIALVFGVLIFIMDYKKTNAVVVDAKKPTTNEIITSLGFDINTYEVIDLKDYAILNNESGNVFIDIKDKKELSFDDIITNKDGFINKIKELSYLKFPKRIVDILFEKSRIEYKFNKNSLYISFNDYKDYIDTNRLFNININYSEINDYLVFNIGSNIEYENESGYIYDPNKVTFALTFDDGPNNNKTLTLIDNLEDYKMCATFFMLGNKLNNQKDVVKTVYNSHSEIGYHSYRHAYLTKQSASEIQSEYEKSNSILKEIVGDEFKLIRPPYGAYNDNTLPILDMPFILWNIDTNDWKNLDSNYLYNYVLSHYKDGAIILFHDSYQTSIDAAVRLMDALYLKDVQVVSVSKLFDLKNIKLDNNTAYRKAS